MENYYDFAILAEGDGEEDVEGEEEKKPEGSDENSTEM